MTLLNWKSKESYIQEKVANGEALDMRSEFTNVKILSKLKQLEEVNNQLTEELVKWRSAKEDIERVAQLTILLSETQRNHQMTENQKPPIECDEVVNNLKSLNEEYDITYNEENGKLFLAYNGTKPDGKSPSEVIVQFINLAKHPGKDKLVGLTIDRTRPKYRDGLLSGIFYIENLPVDLMEKLPSVEENKAEEKKEVTKEELSPKVASSLTAMTLVDKEGKIVESDRYGLRVNNLAPTALKAPQGFSRSERKEWWDTLRKEYPDGFDKGGNYIGFNVEEKKETIAPTEIKAKPKSQLGLLTETGAGNGIYSIIDARVDDRTCFIGRYFEQKNAFAIVSTPTAIGDEHSSAMLFFEKERTADFVLKGLLKSPSWQSKLEGCEVFKASQLSKTIRSDRNRSIYFITNAVTALIALGTQKSEKEIKDVEYEEIKD